MSDDNAPVLGSKISCRGILTVDRWQHGIMRQPLGATRSCTGLMAERASAETGSWSNIHVATSRVLSSNRTKPISDQLSGTTTPRGRDPFGAAGSGQSA